MATKTLNTSSEIEANHTKLNRSVASSSSVLGGCIQLQYKRCKNPNCRCRTDPLNRGHGPYAYYRKYDPSAKWKEHWIYIGRDSASRFQERCLALNLDPKEIAKKIRQSEDKLGEDNKGRNSSASSEALEVGQ